MHVVLCHFPPQDEEAPPHSRCCLCVERPRALSTNGACKVLGLFLLLAHCDVVAPSEPPGASGTISAAQPEFEQETSAAERGPDAPLPTAAPPGRGDPLPLEPGLAGSAKAAGPRAPRTPRRRSRRPASAPGKELPPTGGRTGAGERRRPRPGPPGPHRHRLKLTCCPEGRNRGRPPGQTGRPRCSSPGRRRPRSRSCPRPRPPSRSCYSPPAPRSWPEEETERSRLRRNDIPPREGLRPIKSSPPARFRWATSGEPNVRAVPLWSR